MNAPAAVPAAALRDFSVSLLEHAGMLRADAAILAEVLTWADLRGVDSHGVARLPHYLNFLKVGVIAPRPKMRVVADAPALAILEADQAAGPVAMMRAVELASAKAAAAGIGMALVRATSHTAAIGYYTQQLARAGMAAVGLNASIPMMAYHGTRSAAVSTAPVSIAVPGPGADPVLLDMSTSAISLGKLGQARRQGTVLAPGLALDVDGNPTTDAKAAQIPLPLGGPKGAGLALMIELVTSIAVGNPILANYLAVGAEGRRHRQNALLIAIDVFRFCEESSFRADVARTIAAIKAQPVTSGTTEILVPGERGDAEHARRSRDGIPVPTQVRAELTAAAIAAGIAVPWA